MTGPLSCLCIPLGWLPTADNINALPKPVRDYIYHLETNADPAGMVAENTLLKDQTRQLDAMIARLKSELQDLRCPQVSSVVQKRGDVTHVLPILEANVTPGGLRVVVGGHYG